jgi:hypothetical protein
MPRAVGDRAVGDRAVGETVAKALAISGPSMVEEDMHQVGGSPFNKRVAA